jgi:hypothetical protein
MQLRDRVVQAGFLSNDEADAFAATINDEQFVALSQISMVVWAVSRISQVADSRSGLRDAATADRMYCTRRGHAFHIAETYPSGSRTTTGIS